MLILPIPIFYVCKLLNWDVRTETVTFNNTNQIDIASGLGSRLAPIISAS